MKFTELANKLAKVRSDIKIAEDKIKELKTLKNKLDLEFMEVMNKEGMRSVKTDTHNFSIVKSNDIKIMNLKAIEDWVKSEQKEELFYSLDIQRLKTYAKKILSEEGELLDGTGINETEYLSVRKSKN